MPGGDRPVRCTYLRVRRICAHVIERGPGLAASARPPTVPGELARTRLVERLEARWRVPITTVVAGAGFGKSIALARVPRATGDRAEVEIRGKWYPVRVVRPNFVRHGKALI